MWKLKEKIRSSEIYRKAPSIMASSLPDNSKLKTVSILKKCIQHLNCF